MTNTQLKKEVDTLRENTMQLRSRIGELTDQLVVLERELSNTQRRVQQDVKRLAESISKRRIL